MRGYMLAAIGISIAMFLGPVSAGEPKQRDGAGEKEKAKEKEAEQPAAKAKQPAAKQRQTQIAISTETTFLTGPLDEQGYVDFIEAVNRRASKGATPENNAAAVFWKVWGPPDGFGDNTGEFYRRLGIDPLPEEGDYFVPLSDFIDNLPPEEQPRSPLPGNPDADRESDPSHWLRQAGQRPWSGDGYPLLAKWLAANGGALDRFVAGTKRPEYYSPLIADAEGDDLLLAVLMPDSMHAREVTRALVARAMLRLDAGQVEEATEDILACHRLSRLVADDGNTLIASLVGVAIDHMACDATQAMLTGGKLSEAQIAAFRAQFGKLPPWPPMADAIDYGERLMYVDAVCSVARGGTPELAKLAGLGGDNSTIQKIIDWISKTSIDWNRVLRMGNETFDRLVTIARLEAPTERRRAQREFEDEIKQLAAEVKSGKAYFRLLLKEKSVAGVLSHQTGLVFISLLMPAIRNALRMEDAARVNIDLTDLTFALALYKQRHGAYPEKLDELVPKLVEKLPQDHFTGEDYHYRRTDEGFLLYSVGPNLEDDEGRTRDSMPTGDDIVVRPGAE